MNILIIGSGGREHALCWAVSQNPKCETLYCAPGSDGISEVAKSIPIEISDPVAISNFCKNADINLVVIGPEGPLENGLADHLIAAKINTFGPFREAAKLESSKLFTKDICRASNVSTANYKEFGSIEDAKKFVEESPFPLVIKLDGLAAGKGVTISESKPEANKTLDDIFNPNEKNKRVLIEEFMPGEEASLFVITDGYNCLSLGGAQDHKRLKDGDRGPNTGGMGAYSPAPVLTSEIEERALNEIVKPTIKEMADRGTPFKGILYAGLMINDGKPSLVEYNVRFGDPECQVIMMRLGGQILDIILNCLEGNLSLSKVNWANDHALTVVLASKGYPYEYNKGSLLKNIAKIKEDSNLKIFHAGTKKIKDSFYSNGGRVLNVTARGSSLKKARKSAYDTISKIKWEEGIFRKDIGWRGIKN